jgi:hypothetical protein
LGGYTTGITEGSSSFAPNGCRNPASIQKIGSWTPHTVSVLPLEPVINFA